MRLQHRGSTCGHDRWVLWLEVELQDHHLVRLLRSLSTRSIPQGNNDDGEDEHGHHGGHRVPCRIQAPDQSVEVPVPVRSHVYGSTLDCLACLLVSMHSVGAESDQHVNICSFVVRCNRMWPSTH